MKHAAIASTVLFLLSAQMLPAQSPAFEVASVRLNKSGEGQAVPPIQPGGRVTLTNRTLRSLVHFAHSQIDSPIQEFHVIGGPDWVDRDRFDVVAKMDGNPLPVPATANLARLMLRTLLSERFRLVVRSETRNLPAYSLTMARSDGKLGAGLRRRPESDCTNFVPPQGPPDPGSPSLCGFFRGGRGVLTYRGVPMVVVAQKGLSGIGGIDRSVIDRTGIAGLVDIDLEWAPGLEASDRPSIFTAVQEQLGLKLESITHPIPVLIVENAARPTPD